MGVEKENITIEIKNLVDSVKTVKESLDIYSELVVQMFLTQSTNN